MSGISNRNFPSSAPKTTSSRPSSDTESTTTRAPATATPTAQPAVVRDYDKDHFTLAKATRDIAPRKSELLTAALLSQTPLRAAQASVNSSGQAADASSGAEAAARLKNEDNYFTAEWETYRAQDFLETVEAHKDDPAFLQALYVELGPELTSQLMGDAVNAVSGDNHNTYPTEADAQRAFSDVAESLNAMPPSFQEAVGREAGKNNPQAGMILANGASQEAKLGFLEGVKSSALGSGHDASFAARMAGQVIASDPKLVQHVADTWSASDLSTLLKNGLQTPPPSDSFHSDWPSFRADGLERMVGMTADLQGDQYADVRARVFRDASLALGNASTGDPNRQSLVDNLKTLFQSDAQGITSRLFNNTGAADSPFDGSQRALGLFFRDAVFANPGQDPSFDQFVSDFMGDLRGQMLDPARHDDDPNTPSNELFAKQLGDVLGSLVTGYSLAAKDNGEQQAARKALASTIVGLVAKPLDAGGTVGNMVKSEAEKLVSSLLADFLNGDLKADKAGMTRLMTDLINTAYAGARDFDERHGTQVETTMKSETMWVDFIRQLFDR